MGWGGWVGGMGGMVDMIRTAEATAAAAVPQRVPQSHSQLQVCSHNKYHDDALFAILHLSRFCLCVSPERQIDYTIRPCSDVRPRVDRIFSTWYSIRSNIYV